MNPRALSTCIQIVLSAMLSLVIGACSSRAGEPTGRSTQGLTGSATLLVSTSSSRSPSTPLQGSSLPASASVYIFTSDGSGTANPSGVSQVSYWLDDTAMTGTPTHVENFTPYDFVGTADDGTAEAWNTSSIATGTHTITESVTLTSGSAETYTATFTVGVAASAYNLLVSTSPSRSAPAPLAGATLSGSVYIFTSNSSDTPNPPGITEVSYWLDNPAMTGSPTHVEHLTPYDFVGTDTADLTAEAWVTSSVSNGSHTITQSVTPTSGSAETYTATFTVKGGGSSSPDAGSDSGGSTGPSGSGTCSPTASGPGGAGAANVPGSNVPAFPKLSSPYTVTGLDTSGGADVGAIIQTALSSHSQIIIPGSGSFGSPYRYNVATQVNVPEGAIIECETGAEFEDETPREGNMAGLFLWSGTASVSGAGMYGCMFRGSAANIAVPTSYNHSFIRLNSASNYTIEGNYTTNSCGDADIRLDGPENSASNHGSTHNLIAFNDTENAENGIALINAWNNTVMCNTAFNGGLVDEEPNQSYPQCGDNTFTKNYEEQTMLLPDGFQMGTSVGGNGTSCPSGSGVCATDTVTDNVFNGNGFGQMGVDCECNGASTACDNASFGGVWSGNILVGGTKCGCGDEGICE
jgi:hypothetical protein